MDRDTEQALVRFRNQIDHIDAEILELINCRLKTAQSIAEIKRGLQEPAFYRPEREAQVLTRLQALNKGLLKSDSLERLFREIMSITRGTEAGLSVAVLGPLGTYTEAAAQQHFGRAVEIKGFPTIEEIFRSTESGKTDFSVVPVENSTEGGVTGTLDRLVNTSLLICGEISLQIHHNLLSQMAKLEDIKKIYAHTQSLGQCKKWLDQHFPNVERVPVSSNAEAAKIAEIENHSAAIAGEVAATRYKLNILFSAIEDEPGNTTRFLILSDRATPPSGKDKTSLLLSFQSKPGALLNALQPLRTAQVDMSKIESRPSKVGLWDYVFFIDIIGHQDEPHIRQALEELKQKTGLFKNLGSYPMAI